MTDFRWVVSLLVFSVASANAADFSQIGPQASAIQIINARESAEQPVLELVYAVSGGEIGPPTSLTIDLASNYTYVRGGQSAKIIDYKLRRSISLNETDHSFDNVSLYAMVDFKMAETFNRRMQRGLLAKLDAKIATDILDPFWVQSSLHVMDSADPTPALDQQTGTDGSVHVFYNKSEVASYAFSGQALSDSERVEFERFLQEDSTLHPLIIKALVSTGRLPQQLYFATPPELKKNAERWTLQSVSRQSMPYPLPNSYNPKLVVTGLEDSAPSDLKQVLPLMLSAVAGHAGDGPRTVAQYRALMAIALQQKNGLQAALWLFEANEQYGLAAFNCPAVQGSDCRPLNDILAEAKGDSRVGILVSTLQVEQTDPTQAIKMRRGLRHDDVVNGYVIDGFIGNTLVGMGKTDEALPLLIDEVKGDPYVSGYYKDLGDLFRESFEPVLAWMCYDLGRSLPGGSSAPVVDTLTAHEAQLATKYPQFF